MITKKDYENLEIISKDKLNFINYALQEGFNYVDINNFMPYYQNLNSFKENLKELKGGL